MNYLVSEERKTSTSVLVKCLIFNAWSIYWPLLAFYHFNVTFLFVGLNPNNDQPCVVNHSVNFDMTFTVHWDVKALTLNLVLNMMGINESQYGNKTGK